jgi:hypothetical protein
MNTMRQLGAVLGSAAVGALLQVQLARQLGESADRNADALPASFRPRFLEGFHRAATGRGIEIGTGQTGAHIPADIPSSVRPAIEQVATKAFYEAYVPAMRATLLLPVIVLAVAALAAFLVRPDEEPAEASSDSDEEAVAPAS